MELNDLLTKTDAISLHNLGLSGKGVKVAILDSGVDVNHEIFEGKDIRSFQLAEGNVHDGFNHGTHVASIFTTIAPSATILNIKVLNDQGDTQISTIMKGIELADKEGADIINISVGEVRYDCPDGHPLTRLINKVVDKGIMVVCSAGNSGPRTSPCIPASCKNTIAVGSAHIKGRTNVWSSKGPSCGNKYPDCISYGDQIVAAFPNNQYGTLSGSSQAAPQVTGMLALIKEATGKNFTRPEIEQFLSESCDYLESYDKNNSSGWGIINMMKFYTSVMVYIKMT